MCLITSSRIAPSRAPHAAPRAFYIQRCCEDESRTPAAQRKGLGARLDSLTNLAALKEECRAHGLPASGTKAKLSQRLRDYASGVEPAKGKRRRGA